MNDGTCNAVIESQRIGIERGSFLDCWLFLDYGDGGHQGFGGWVLHMTPDCTHYKQDCGHAGEHLMQCMRVADVEKWDDVVGKCVRAKIEDGLVVAIGHITKDIWFEPREVYGKDKKDA